MKIMKKKIKIMLLINIEITNCKIQTTSITKKKNNEIK